MLSDDKRTGESAFGPARNIPKATFNPLQAFRVYGFGVFRVSRFRALGLGFGIRGWAWD